MSAPTPDRHPEFVPEWDVYRDENGKPVTITLQQCQAIWHAIGVVNAVRAAEDHRTLWQVGPGQIPQAEISKSRLLGRMLFEGRPPTRTRPPVAFSGPDWDALPGGDPFTPATPGRGAGATSPAFARYTRIASPTTTDQVIDWTWGIIIPEAQAFWAEIDAAVAAQDARPAPGDEVDVALAAIAADRNQLREALRRIALGVHGASVFADKAVMASLENARREPALGALEPPEPAPELAARLAETEDQFAQAESFIDDYRAALTAMQAERDRLRAAMDTLTKVTKSHERVMFAAGIDIRRGDPGAGRLLLGEQLGGWDGMPPWNGTETGAEYLERTSGGDPS